MTRPELPADLAAAVEACFAHGYDRHLGGVMNQWNLHRRASRAMHHYEGQAGCFKCQDIAKRLRWAVAHFWDVAPAAEKLQAQPLPGDITARLALLGASFLDGRIPNREPVVCAGELSEDQQKSLDRWFGHCRNIRAEHHELEPDQAAACGGCRYLWAELRDVLGLPQPTSTDTQGVPHA